MQTIAANIKKAPGLLELAAAPGVYMYTDVYIYIYIVCVYIYIYIAYDSNYSNVST